MSTVRFLGRNDVDPSALARGRIAVLGYGSQGRAHALNLRDSGADVIVGLREGGPSSALARKDGFRPVPLAHAAQAGDVIAFLMPDTAQPDVYAADVAPNVRPGDTLLFAHGFNIHYGQIAVPEDVDVVLVAPKSPGAMLRREYEAGRGVPALVAVHQDASGRALALALAYADAIGATRAGVLETTFADETETDLFGEQAVLCGGLSALVKAGFETLVEAGYAPELAYFECLHEMKLIVDLVYAGGLEGMRQRVSDTAEYGDYTSGSRVIGDASRTAMKEILEDIRSACFAQRWTSEMRNGGTRFHEMRATEAQHPLSDVGQKLRANMTWLQEQP
jgi:ketol-acid reductoisomerase